MRHKEDANPFASADKKPGLFSFLGAAGIFLVCSVLGYTILDRQLYTNMLLAYSGAEQTMNNLFAVMREERVMGRHGFGMMLREFSDIDETLEDYPQLSEKIAGIGWYSSQGKILVRYGDVPDVWEGSSGNGGPGAHGEAPLWEDSSWRNYSFDEDGGTLRVVLHIPAPRMRRNQDGNPETFLLSLRQKDYWKKNRMAWGVFIGWELLILFVIWRMRSLLIKNRAYRQKLQEQKELVSLGAAARTLAHEIKNPLSAIQLQADIIARVCPDKVSSELDAITQEVGRLKRLTDRMGDFLREPKGFPVPLDLGEFARAIAKKSGSRLQFSTEPGIWIVADADRLHSMIENLVRNALESGSEAENVELRVSRSAKGPASAAPVSSWALVEVLDRGKGLPNEKAGRLFDPFFTTKSKGSGLGLAIAWRFALAAGGSLKIENRDGGGARAALEIPCAEESVR